MSVFYNNDITNKGRQLFALMQDGGKFMPTRIVMGSGYMPQGTTTSFCDTRNKQKLPERKRRLYARRSVYK